MDTRCINCGFKTYKVSDYEQFMLVVMKELLELRQCPNCKQIHSELYMLGFRKGYNQAKKEAKRGDDGKKKG